MLDASAVGAALNRSLPVFTAVDLAALRPTLDTLAENVGCGVRVFDFDDAFSDWTRLWYEESYCVDEEVRGFGQESDFTIDPDYNPGMTGTVSSVFWNADVWGGDLRVWGNATWAVQDYVLDDGTAGVVTVFDGHLQTNEIVRSTWIPGDTALEVVHARVVDPDGAVTTTLSGGSAVDDPDVDGVHLSEVRVEGGCTGSSGIASVHAIDGDWYDLTITSVAEDCTGCGEVTHEGGAAVGATCIDLGRIVDFGGAR